MFCAQICWAIVFQWGTFTGGDDGILSIWPSEWASNKIVFYYLTLVLCTGGVLALRAIIFTPFGYTLRACRDSALPARTGGEELALLLNHTRLEEAAQLCARLRGLFHDHPDWAGVDGLRVTFSAGQVELDADDRTPCL